MTPTDPHATGEHGEPAARTSARGPLDYPRRALKALASLRLTVVLFAVAVGLVFFGTLAQIDYGIWTVVDKYFWSWCVNVPTDLFRKFLNVFWKEWFPPEASPWTAKFPFPAGKLVGALMLVNLLAAHATRFRLSWKRAGIFLIHGGLILLFVGEFVTREFAVEQRMTIDEGKSADFAEETRTVELAIVDKSQPDADRVFVIPQDMLKGAAGRITDPALPVDVERVGPYLVNAELVKAEPGADNPATAGLGLTWVPKKLDEVSGVDTKAGIDTPATYVKLYKKGTDEAVGTFLVSLQGALLRVADEFDLDGKPHELLLRFKRHYKPYSVHLDKFRFDRYMGTDKPMNYSSDVRVSDADGKLVRQTRIAMNEPLRYAGETFYQADFDKRTEKTTVLQVVKNPGWLLPYVSCFAVTVGLLLHFGIYLVRFLLRGPDRRPVVAPVAEAAIPVAPPPADEFALSRLLPWAMLGLAALVLLMAFARMNPPRAPYNLEAFGRMPVVDGGRVKPLDTVARVNLRIISGREEYEDANGKMQPAVRWYLEALATGGRRHRGAAWKQKIFRIDNEQVLQELELKTVSGLRYSLDDIGPKLARIEARSRAADQKVKKGEKPDLTDAKFEELHSHIGRFLKLAEFGGPLLLPPAEPGGKWDSLGDFRQKAQQDAFAELRAKIKLTPEEMKNLKPEDEAALEAEFDRKVSAGIARNPAAANWEALAAAYRNDEPEEFNAAVDKYRTVFAADAPDKNPVDNLFEKALYTPFNSIGKLRVEAAYNRFAPFYQCAGLYVFGFLLAVIGYFLSVAEKPRWAAALRRSATAVLLLTLAVHTLALLTRMYIMDRPGVFVTNLYSSAIFIGWGCVALCLVVERVFPVGIGNAVAALLGLASCIVAHNLASEDTLEMMQAVLDTNFWLATHVTTVTLGYTATFVAGFLGALYVEQVLATVVRDSFRSRAEPTVGALLAFGLATLGAVALPLAGLWFVTTALAEFRFLPPAVLWGGFYLVAAAGAVYALLVLLLRVSYEAVDAHGRPLAGEVPGLARPLVGAAFTPESSKVLGQMMYGVLCFATLLSFVGTVLGGIWADQSWGRFWGWDPKENGAVLIVLWNSLILHARWAGLVKERGVAVLALFGNAITAWSWFGTNQLGIGLHAYGFDTRLADGCFNFWLSQLFVLALGAAIPRRFWASATRRPPPPTTLPVGEVVAPPAALPAGAPPRTEPRRDKGNRNGKRRT